MKRLFSVLAFLMLAVTIWAIPAKRVKRVITLKDGTQMTVTLMGDEHMKYYMADDGQLVRRTISEEYEIMSTQQFSSLRERATARASKMQKARGARKAAHTGKKKGLVLLVNFTDAQMKSTSTQAVFNSMLNEVGYNKNGHIGSVRDYFLAQSYNQLDIEFDVIGPLTLSNNMRYYGANDSNGDDLRPATMAAEACKLADPLVNFADYDWNGDGEVDQVYIIYAGYGEAQDAPSYTIWPHEWDLESGAEYGDGPGALTLDKVKINTYACSSELKGNSGSTIDGIGTCCHEFSHCLGLPDLYDTSGSYTSNFGMDAWSIMDYGAYSGDGCVPTAYTAYERMASGWLTPTEITEPTHITNMHPITNMDEHDAYIIYNKGNRNEYYILQNVQKEGWNSYADGHGLLIIHVDYDAKIWAENTVNNVRSHQRCTVVHADNKDGSYANDLAGDPFPGTNNNRSFTDNTTPASTLFNPNEDKTHKLGMPLTKITEKNGLISFTAGQVEGGGEDFTGEEILFDFTQNLWNLPISNNSASTEITEVTQDGAKLTLVSNGPTPNRMWDDNNVGKQLRLYKDATLTVTAPANRSIMSIDFTATKFGLLDSSNYVVSNSSTTMQNGSNTYSFFTASWEAPDDESINSETFRATNSTNICTLSIKLVKQEEGIHTSTLAPAFAPALYDMQGRRTNTPRPHTLYINKGKKYLAR